MNGLRILLLVLAVTCGVAFCANKPTTDDSFFVVVDGKELVLNYDPFPQDFTARPNGASGTFLPRTNQTMSIPKLSDDTDINYDNGITIEFWFMWKGLVQVGWEQATTLFYWGNSPTDYLWYTPCNGDYGTVNTLPSCVGVFKGMKNGVPFQAVTNSIMGLNIWNHFALVLHPTDPAQSYLYLTVTDYFGYGFLTGSTPEVYYDIPLGLTWKASDYPNAAMSVGYIASPTGRNALSSNFGYAGKVCDFRIWNALRSRDTIIAEMHEYMSGYEPNLTRMYSFDDDARDDQNVFDTAKNKLAPRNAALSNPVSYTGSQLRITLIEGILQSPGAIPSGIPMTSLSRHLPYNGFWQGGFVSSHQVAKNNATTQAVYAYVTGFPTEARLCTTWLSSADYNCQAYGPLDQSKIVKPFRFTFLPLRGACNTTQVVKFSALDGDEYAPEVTFTFEVGGVVASIAPGNNYTLPTNGGNVIIQGNGLGLDLQLDDSEFVEFPPYIAGVRSANMTCKTAVVSGGGKTITCAVPEGVGNRRMVVKVCGQTFALNTSLNFMPPTITTAFGSGSNLLLIRGTNLGPNRPFDGVTDSILVDGAPCDIRFANHTEMTCTISGLGQQQYHLEITIGGQKASTDFVFANCTPACVHGKCIYTNKCDCSLTGYDGLLCEKELVCEPACKNNGTCVTATDGSSDLKCNCPEPWTGDDCGVNSKKKKDSAALIGGVVGGGGGVVLLLGAAVIVLLIKRKQGKRGGKNFIPLEKKDFNKIIYGDQLTQTPEKASGNPKLFEETLTNGNLELAVAISNVTQITEADKIAKAMIVVFQENNKVLELLEAFITEEVNTTESAGTLFRSNSMVSKMFKFYSRLIGLPYLYETIGPELCELIEQELGLEVDPEKMEEGTDLDEMRWTLMAQSQKILKQILKSVERCPAQFRSLLSHIRNSVSERFPENVNTTIGGFIFLRFFCPAVSSPEAYGIVEEPPSASSRRLLILITKVLQNLSNDVEFGSKEPYMTKMNDFIHSNRLKLIQFYEALVKPSAKPPVTLEMPKHIKQLSVQVLMHHMRENIARVEDPQMRAKIEAML